MQQKYGAAVLTRGSSTVSMLLFLVAYVYWHPASAWPVLRPGHAVAGHGISESLVEDIFGQCKEFFSLPEAEKRNIIADENNRQGSATITYTPHMQHQPQHPPCPSEGTLHGIHHPKFRLHVL